MDQPAKLDQDLYDMEASLEAPSAKKPRRSTARSKPAASATRKTPMKKRANDSDEDEDDDNDSLFDPGDDSDYNPVEDAPSPKTPRGAGSAKKRGRGGGARTPRSAGGGRGRGRTSKAKEKDYNTDDGSTDVDEEDFEDFEIQEGEDDAEDIFADDGPTAKDKIYEFDTESVSAAPAVKRRYVAIRPAGKSAQATTASTWGTNIYSAISTSLKSRADLDNYSNFLRSPHINTALDRFLIDYCKPSNKHSALFFGPSASLQALLSRVTNSDVMVHFLSHFMSLQMEKTSYNPSVLVPLVHQQILPVDGYSTMTAQLESLGKCLGYQATISPGYYLNSENIYRKAKLNSSYSTHQLVTLYSFLPMAGYTDLVTNVLLSPATYKQFESYVSVPHNEVIDYAEDVEDTAEEKKPDCLGRVVMVTDSNGKVLALSIVDTCETEGQKTTQRQHLPFNLPVNPNNTKPALSAAGKKKTIREEVQEVLDEALDWVCLSVGGGGEKSQSKKPRTNCLAGGLHILDTILLTSNAKPHLLLAVGIKETANPPLPMEAEIGSLIICSLASDEQTFLTNQGVTPNMPLPPKGRFLLDSTAFLRERSTLAVPDPLYANIRRMAITEVISSSGAVAGLGIAALPVSKENEVKWLILDANTHIPLCMAVKLPFSFAMQTDLHEVPRIRATGKATANELASFSEDQLQMMESHFHASQASDEYRVAVINGIICALKVDFDSCVIHKVIELVPASYENIYPDEEAPLYACQVNSGGLRSVSTCLRVFNKDTNQTSFLPAVHYTDSDGAYISRIVAGYCDQMVEVLERLPLKISLYDVALRLALRDTPKILARQHRISALASAEEHRAANPDGEPLDIPAVPDRWNVCTICLREFHSNIGLYHHELRHINVGRYQCHVHDTIFISEEAFKRHMATKEHATTKSKDDAPLPMLDENEEEKEPDWISDSVLKLFEGTTRIGEVKIMAPQCKICGDYFPTADVIMQHQDVCTGTSLSNYDDAMQFKLEDEEDEKTKKELFTCGICGVQLETKPQLNSHFIETHLTCVVCLQTQRSLEELSYHYGAHLAKADPLLLLPTPQTEENDIGTRLRSIQTCEHCTNYHATGSNFQYHIATEHGIERSGVTDAPLQHGGAGGPGNESAEDKNAGSRRMKLMQCKFCDLEVPVAGTAYVDHLRQVHNVDVGIFQICRICAEVFPSDTALSAHIAEEHPLSVYALAGIQSVYSCPKCVFFAFYRGMMNHCREVHKDPHPEIYECTHCGQRFAERFEYRRHSESHTAGYNFQCPDCSRSFRLRMSLMIHIKNHHSNADEEGPKACEFCGLVYPSGRLLKQHIDRTHNKELKLECTECGRRFRLETDLRRHIKEMHSGAVKCEVCNKVCANLRSYSLHRNKHFRMRVFQCTDCNATFKSKASMKRHIRVDHLNLGPERFECQICGKIVCQIGMHMLTHKGTRFICEYCGKGFTKSAYYNEHIRIHKGELPYECYICHKRFNKKSNLNVHLKFHEKNRDADGNYIELRSRGRYSVMFGDAALTPEQRMARQSALNFAIMPTEHIAVGPDEPGAFNVGGEARAAEKACAAALEGYMAELAAPLGRANEQAAARFDQMLATEDKIHSNGTPKSSLKVTNGGPGSPSRFKSASPKRIRFPDDDHDDDYDD